MDPSSDPDTGNARAARLSSVEGQVKVTQDGQVIADPATENLPLFAGTQIVTGNDGRVEVQFDDGSVARLSPNSALTLPVLQKDGTSTKTELVVNSGLSYFEMQPSTPEHSLKVSYGSATFSASSFTVARVTLDAAPGELAVFSGNVHLERGETLQLDLHGGESLTMDSGDAGKYNVAENIEPDSWDSWNADRDQLLNSESAEKTSATAGTAVNESPGMGDLDANGNWYDVPGRGYVWSPYDAQLVGASWDPYGYGSWVYYPRYGYVWVSGYGWGYAPFQCGMWNFYDGFGWGWEPGISGCSPWFGSGGWGYNIGNPPRGYRPPRRPFPGPVHPRTGPGGPIKLASIPEHPAIPIDRRVPEPTGLLASAHSPQPVVIGGHTVEPLKPLAPRSTYDRAATSFISGRVGGTGRPGSGYSPSPSHPAYGTGYAPAPAGRGGQVSQSTYRPSQSGSSKPSSSPGGGGSRSSYSAPSGGGGGGGSHAGGAAPSGGGSGSHH